MYLIDAHSLIFQVFHAIPAMTSPAGLPTNALFGFSRDLLWLRAEKKPDYLLCVFDHPAPTFRSEIFPDYKAHRAPMDPDLQTQLPLIEQMVKAMGVPVISQAGFEADDLLATIAKAASERGLEVFICTSDKDCRQLIDDHVKLYSLRKHQEFGREELLQDWGVKPEQVIDLQALVGDPVDNVPGVPGIGIKTAAKLLQEFGTIENILANVDKIAGAKRQENLRAAADKLPVGRKLVRLETAVPMEMDWEGWRLRDWDGPRLLQLFQQWGFRRFADEVRKTVDERVGSGGSEENTSPQQGELFPLGTDSDSSPPPHSPLPTPSVTIVNTPEKLTEFLAQLRTQKRFAFDLETIGRDPLRSEIVGIAFCWQPGEAYYVALRAPAGEKTLDAADTLRQLMPVFEDARVAKVNQDIKFDVLALRAQGVRVAGVAGDSMVADYLLNAGERSHGIDELALREFRQKLMPINDLIGKAGKGQLVMDQVATARMAEYAGQDAEFAFRLCERLEAKLEQPARGENKSALPELYRELEVPLIDVLAELEFTGIRIDVPRLRRLSEEMTRQLADIEQEIHRLAGRSFNIASPKQLREVLFKELKLPTQRRTGISGEASTDQETLERLAEQGHELPTRIVEHRQVAKLKGTYVDTLPQLINPRTGRLHASFNQTVAATGRLSSSDPNLQNIPVRTEQGRQIRQAFLPEEGWQLLTADYSQIELRLLAQLCGDEALRRAFAEDRDIHAAVAAQVFGVAEADVSAEMRRLAKVVNFGVLYGMSAFGLSQRLRIDRDEAARFIDAYFARYPRVQEYQTRLLDSCRKRGYVTTLLGRRREITGIRANTTYQQRNQPEREAVNMEIQGSAADLLKLAMLGIHRRLRGGEETGRNGKHGLGYRARMLLTVHDELVFEVPPEELDEVVALVREEMTTPLEKRLKLEVPLRVDIAVGPNWLDVEEVVPEALAVAGAVR